MESNSNGQSGLIVKLIVLVITVISLVNCGNQSSSTTPLPILPLPLKIPSSTLPILSSQLTSVLDKSYVIPVRLKLSKNDNSTKPLLEPIKTPESSSSLIPVETKSNIFRWFPFNRLFRRQSRQSNVQIAVTITLAITAALSAIILALLIALLISIGSLGYAVKKCSFGFGSYLFKLFGSVDQHSHKFINIIHMIIRVLIEVSGRQHHQTDFLFHLIHIIREVGIERQNQRLLATHEININEHGPSSIGPHGPHSSPSHQHDLSSYPGFSESSRGFPDQSSARHRFEHAPIPKRYSFPREYRNLNREEETPLSYTNKTNDYEYSNDQSTHGSQPNLQYQNPYLNGLDSSRSEDRYDSDQHPNHKYD